jgi:hypothetical protein
MAALLEGVIQGTVEVAAELLCGWLEDRSRRRRGISARRPLSLEP